MKKDVFGLGFAQFGLTALAIAAAGSLFGLPANALVVLVLLGLRSWLVVVGFNVSRALKQFVERTRSFFGVCNSILFVNGTIHRVTCFCYDSIVSRDKKL
jgi:hypothetical protein